ncbi:hypothetical protein AQ490_23150 [Wenjunlia vitaminophila]|uniref:Uncharacterized protein n=1 Tax=Wenjunlia vitaminophila TaxID=76728 RepID=A0A0T6LRL6_WENVI|nr:hypothetical protein AQ490_23150 [Wenjunlia vitaminophila]
MTVGRHWDAVRADRRVAEPALELLLRGRCGSVIRDDTTYTWLVPVGSTRDWPVSHLAWRMAAGEVAVPPPHRVHRPGPHWRVPWRRGRYLTDSTVLRRALGVDAAGRGEEPIDQQPPARWTPPPGPGVTTVSAGGPWDCALIARTLAERVISRLGDRCGAVIADWDDYYLLLPPGARPHLSSTPLEARVLERGYPVPVPPPHRRRPPGPYWRVPLGSGRFLTDPTRLRAAVDAGLEARRRVR